MSLHKLSAGDGYTYLTRQVAAHDSTERSQAGLGAYYTEKGESPGRWLGAGLSGLGMSSGSEVTEAQMKLLFGQGRHPLADEADGMPATSAALGRPFANFDASTLRRETAESFSLYNASMGKRWNEPIPEEQRSRIRTEVATRMFAEKYVREPLDDRELAGFLARASRPAQMAVSGYDLTFSPVKSVSALWALAPTVVAEQVAAAHDAAVRDTLGWLEQEVAFTRVGRAGARQVPVTGLVAAGFTHRDSRAGDPDLHTHVAVSNKVQTLPEEGGRWLSLDGRVLFKAKVAASERYNTRLEAELVARLGVRFTGSPTASGRRPIREVEGISPLLLLEWSSRRTEIEARTEELSSAFQGSHGRLPTRVEALALAQQANLETRAAKHEPRAEAEQRRRWRAQAVEVMGDGEVVDAMVASALGRRTPDGGGRSAAAEVERMAARVVEVLEGSRATWQVWHARAEAQRQARGATVPLAVLDATVETVVIRVLQDLSVRLGGRDPVVEPAVLRRPDGASVYEVHGATRYTSRRILDAEQTLLKASSMGAGRVVGEVRVGLVLAEATANGTQLDASQMAMVRSLATSGARLQVAVAPAGSGKTSTLGVLADVWRASAGQVLGLAPSAVAAHQLGDAINDTSDTLAKLIHSLAATSNATSPDAYPPTYPQAYPLDTRAASERVPKWVSEIGPRTLVIIDEAGMAGTADLAAAVSFIIERGGVVRLVGDDQQLASVAAGGILRDLAHRQDAYTQAPQLTRLHRFSNPVEAAVTLAVRAGDVTALGYYADHQRIHVGAHGRVVDQAFDAWRSDQDAGLDSLLLAPTRGLVAALNQRARKERRHEVADSAAGREVTLGDGTRASQGDVILTRGNDRGLRVSDTDWVKNGDRWQVTAILPNGALKVERLGRPGRSRQHATLPSTYVGEHVELGYATTIHAAQGLSVDTTHSVLTGEESRQLLYVALSRGRHQNHLYVIDETDASSEPEPIPGVNAVQESAAVDVLTAILRQDGAQHSATTTHAADIAPAAQLREAVLRYQDALGHLAQTTLGVSWTTSLDARLEQELPGITAQPAYPTLRGHLALRALDGVDPIDLTRRATWPDGADGLTGARDPAAVLDWRLDNGRRENRPLPWLPSIPAQLDEQPEWGPYLLERHSRVRDLAERVFTEAVAWTPGQAPAWAVDTFDDEPQSTLRGDLAIWRAANAIPETDTKPTGRGIHGAEASRHQQQLQRRVDNASHSDMATSNHLHDLPAEVRRDPRCLQLIERFAEMENSRPDVADLLRTALAQPRPLPADTAADALWWRTLAVGDEVTALSPPSSFKDDEDPAESVGRDEKRPAPARSEIRTPWTRQTHRSSIPR